MKAKSIEKVSKPNAEITELFNQMIGEGQLDPCIILPKYESIVAECYDIIRMLTNIFIDKKFLPDEIFNEYINSFRSVEYFCSSSTKYLESITLDRIPIQPMPPNYMFKTNSDFANAIKLQLGVDPEQLHKNYMSLKSSQLVDKIITAVRDLNKIVFADKKTYKKLHHDLEFKDQLSDSFITKYDDDYLVLIPSITGMDFKQIWLHPQCNYRVRQRFVYGMYLLLDKGNRIVKHILNPDIDVQKFSHVLVNSLNELRKQLPRCDKAFDKILNSVSLLEDNFSTYYKDFLVAQNPTIIIESFIGDISKTAKTDANTVRQFRSIIEYCRSKFTNNHNDTRIEKIFEILNSNMKILESKTNNEDSELSKSNNEESESE